jgi:hypothetical protein
MVSGSYDGGSSAYIHLTGFPSGGTYPVQKQGKRHDQERDQIRLRPEIDSVNRTFFLRSHKQVARMSECDMRER